MPCDHVGPKELIEMAECELRTRGEAEVDWNGSKFRWTENTDGGFWTSVILEIERRGEEWVVVRLDRLKELQPETETGLRAV